MVNKTVGIVHMEDTPVNPDSFLLTVMDYHSVYFKGELRVVYNIRHEKESHE